MVDILDVDAGRGEEILMDYPVNFRMRRADFERIEAIVKDNPDLYESESHFIRCAILRQIRHYKDVGGD